MRSRSLPLGLEKNDLLRIGEYLALLVLATLVLLLVVKPIVTKAIDGRPIPAARHRAELVAGRTAAPALEGPEAVAAISRAGGDARPEEMIDINRVEGRVKASSVKLVGEIVDKHPEESLAIVRSWLHSESRRAEVPRPANDGRNVSGPARAAIFMLAIGDAHAGKLLQMMDDDEIRALSQQMAHLGNINSEAVESLLHEFSEHISSAGALVGTFESTERLLSKNLDADRVETHDGGDPRSRGPDHVGQARQRERGRARQLPEERIPADRRGGAVEDQADARRARAGAAARGLRAGSASCGCCAWRRCREEILDKIERTLRTEFMSQPGAHANARRHEMMADIFNNFDRADREPRFITALEERNREAAERIRAPDVHLRGPATLDPAGVQTLLRQCRRTSWPRR